MKRLPIPCVRENWQSKIEEDGILWSTTENGPYWTESMERPVYYSFTAQEQLVLERAGNELHKMCMDSLTWLLEEASEEEFTTWMDAFCIPNSYRDFILQSWDNDDWGLYGRFDFIMTDTGPKLLEYNADTPTTLIESAITQWNWFDDVREKLPTGISQFNEIHEALVRHWTDMRIHKESDMNEGVHFVAYSQVDDMATVAYMAETAKEADLNVTVMPIEGIGINKANDFIGLKDEIIFNCFKLYPWEWIWDDEFGKYVPDSFINWIEPPWKALLSNKALLALLWSRYPNHEFLVPAYLYDTQFEPKKGERWVTKPLLSREGANVTFWKCTEDGSMIPELKTDGEYDTDHVIYQQYIEWTPIDGVYPMLGVWIVGEDAVGLGIREDDSPITKNNSRFIPHVFEVE